MLIAVLCALGVAGRAAFFMLPQFKPVMALTIISGVALGGETGFLVGAVTMLVSNILFSQGSVDAVPDDSAWASSASSRACCSARGCCGAVGGLLCTFGALCALIIYGGLMNPVAALLARQELNCRRSWRTISRGFPVDCVHAVATCFFLLVLAEPMLEKLDRIKVKYGIVE